MYIGMSHDGSRISQTVLINEWPRRIFTDSIAPFLSFASFPLSFSFASRCLITGFVLPLLCSTINHEIREKCANRLVDSPATNDSLRPLCSWNTAHYAFVPFMISVSLFDVRAGVSRSP